MTELRMFDGASMFDLAKAKAAGGIACSVYIVGTPGGMPHADKARVDAIHAAGMGVLANWERAADFFSTCTLTDAHGAGSEALAAMTALGFPHGLDCAFSFDVDIPAARYPEMLAKLEAVQSGLGAGYRAIAYAEKGLIDFFAEHRQVGPHWLMMSTFNEPYGVDAHVGIIQQHTAAGAWEDSPVPGTDVNTVLQPRALGIWWQPGSPYAKPPATPTPPARFYSAGYPVLIVDETGHWALTVHPDGKVVKAHDGQFVSELT